MKDFRDMTGGTHPASEVEETKVVCSHLGERARAVHHNPLDDNVVMGSRVGSNPTKILVDPLLICDVNLVMGQVLGQMGVSLGQHSDGNEECMLPVVEMALLDERPKLGQGSGPIPDPLISVSSGSVRGPLSGPIGDMIVQLAETMSNELPKENLGSSPSPPSLVPPTGFVWKFL